MAGKLKPYEQDWLDEYQEALRQKYAGVFDRLFTFSRDDSRIHIPDYTVNVVVVLKKGDRQTIRDVKFLGADLAALSEAFPLIWAYTEEDWQCRKKEGRSPVRHLPPEEQGHP